MNISLIHFKLNSDIKAEIVDQIIDDSALIDCVNKLNSLRENMDERKSKLDEAQFFQRSRHIFNVNQINAEMRWYSQCMASSATPCVSYE